MIPIFLNLYFENFNGYVNNIFFIVRRVSSLSSQRLHVFLKKIYMDISCLYFCWKTLICVCDMRWCLQKISLDLFLWIANIFPRFHLVIFPPKFDGFNLFVSSEAELSSSVFFFLGIRSCSAGPFGGFWLFMEITLFHLLMLVCSGEF